MSNLNKTDIDYILTPKAVRQTTLKVYEQALLGRTHFELHLDKLGGCAEFVSRVIESHYPDLNIPFHSRWGHFKVGGVDREKELTLKLNLRDPMELARVKLDLVIVSVLLDAGAGPDWKYLEGELEFTRSEGLAVASYHMFLNGDFSSDGSPSVSIEGLKNFSEKKLKDGFQVSPDNPLVGIKGRAELIKKLAFAIETYTEYFPKKRPGSLIDYLCESHGKHFEVSDILDAVLKALSPIWPGRIEVDGVNLGDTWHYPPFGELSVNSVVCFHKLSQWLTYSLVGPMVEAGVLIDGAEKLTGLAEYRNGGLFLDMGVLSLRDELNLKLKHPPSSELIIEWRALTIQLLDQLGVMIQKKFNKTAQEFPLAKVLEGGSWRAGRKLAFEKRTGGLSVLTLDSDGTVF